MENINNKKSKDDVIQELQGIINGDFIKDDPGYKSFLKRQDELKNMGENSEMEYEENLKRIDRLAKKLDLVVNQKFVGGYTTDDVEDIEVNDVVVTLGGKEIFRDDHFEGEFERADLLEVIRKFVDKYEDLYKKSYEPKGRAEYKEFVEKIDSLESEINNLKKSRNFFNFISVNKKIKELKKEYDLTKRRFEKFHIWETFLTSFKDSYEKINESKEEIENIRQTFYENVHKNFYGVSYYDAVKFGEITQNNIDKKIQEVKNFKLAKLYRENESTFIEQNENLLDIFNQQLDKKSKQDFNMALVIYDRSVQMAKLDKVEIEKLDENEQFSYFLKAQHELSKENIFDNHK